MSYDDEQSIDGPAELRKAYEKLKKQLEAEQAKNAELDKKVTTSTLNQILADKKVPAHIQKYLKKDVSEANESAVDKWLNENGTDFGWKPGEVQEESEGVTPPEAPAQASAPQAQSVLTPEQQEALARVQEIFGSTSGQSTMPADTAQAAVDKVASNTNVGHSTFTTPYEDVVRQLAAEGFDIAGDIKY